MEHRYTVAYGDQHNTGRRYCVLDSKKRKAVFADDSKVIVICKAQELNGWFVNGSETTYGLQIEGSMTAQQTGKNEGS